MISLLGLPYDLSPEAPARANGLTSFLSGLPEYLSRCEFMPASDGNFILILKLGQTFEGGISSAPQTEAHGAYAFCILACLSIIGPPHEMIPK